MVTGEYIWGVPTTHRFSQFNSAASPKIW